MEEDKPKIHESETYYHALYHHVTHWAAYLALMGFLLTIGVVVSLSPPVGAAPNLFQVYVRLIGIAAAIVAAMIGACFFMTGMDRYGGLLHENLPEYYLRKTLALPHAKMIRLAKAAAILLGLWDIGILFLLGL